MTVSFEINGMTYESAGGGPRELEDRIRMAINAPGHEVFIDVQGTDGRSRPLHILPGSIGTH